MLRKNFLFKFTLLSISLLLTSASAISMTIPMIQADFPEVSQAFVESLVTIPSFSMMIFVLLSGFLSSKIGTKNTVLLGLFLSLIGGIGPIFVSSFPLIFFSRLIFGAGIGCYNSLAVSLIHEFYEGDEKQALIGFQSAVQSLGSSLVTYLAGRLAMTHWSFAFGIYFLSLPIMILVFLVLPKTQKTTGEKLKQRVNRSIFFYASWFFFLVLFFMIIFTKMGTFVTEKQIGGVENLGLALSLLTLAGFLGGLLYGKAYQLFRQFTPIFVGALLTISLWCLAMSKTMTAMTLCLMVIGFCFAMLSPTIFNRLLKSAPKGSETLAISIGLAFSHIGSFASPYFTAFLAKITGHTTAQSAIVFSGIGFLFLTLLFLLDTMVNHRVKNTEPVLD